MQRPDQKAPKRYYLIIFSLLVILGSVLYFANTPKPTQAFTRTAGNQYRAGSWLAFGEMRSHVEPCGCNPATDLGGVNRVYQAVSELSKQHDAHVFVLGNMYGSSASQQKQTYISTLLSKLEVDAILVNRQEFEFVSTQSSLENLPYVLSNLQQPVDGIASTVSINGAQVYGFLSSKNVSERLLDVAVFLKNLPANKKTPRILLFSGDLHELKQLDSSQQFDTIISANDRILDGEPDQLEVDQLGLLHWFANIYKVPVFSQGVLLGEALRTRAEGASENISSKTLFDDRQPSVDTFSKVSVKNLFGSEKFVVWLDKKFEKPNSMDKAYSLYQLKQGDAFAVWAQDRVSGLKQSSFAGAKNCQPCHQQAYEVWKNSSHSHALATLQNKHKDRDLGCISCHVLGFEEKGGYASQTHSPQFANVQCENCHGPAKEHTQNPSIQPANNAREACVSCHHTPHSTDFSFLDYWQKIQHK